MIHAFIYGFILTFGLLFPLGIQNIFIFNQGATQAHFIHAMPSVITAFVCDSILIILAVQGISLVVLKIMWLKTTFLIVGFCFLAYMGMITWFKTPNRFAPGVKPLSAKQQIAFATSVSLLNPHALLDTVGVIGTSSLQFSGASKWSFTVACMLMSLFWFMGLSVTGHFFHKADETGLWQIRLNKLSALIVWSIALYLGWLVIMGK